MDAVNIKDKQDRMSKECSMNMEHNVEKVLVVEDDMALRPLWSHLFESKFDHITVEWTVSCEEAIKMIQLANINKNPYGLIITDIFLAGSKTGLDLINSEEVIKSGAQTVLVSSVDSREIVKKFSDLIPETVILSKPFDLRKYELILRDLLLKNNNLVLCAA